MASGLLVSSLSATQIQVQQDVDLLSLASNGQLNEKVEGIRTLNEEELQEVQGGWGFGLGILVGVIIGSSLKK